MSKFTNSILVYGWLLPAMAIGVPLVVGAAALFKFEERAQERVVAFNEHHERELQIASLEKEVSPRDAERRQLQRTVSGDVQATLDKTLQTISRDTADNTLERTFRDFPKDPSNVAQLSNINGQTLTLRYLGRIEPMMLASLRLETESPNLFLNELRIERGTGSATLGYSAPHLQFNVNYTAWKE